MWNDFDVLAYEGMQSETVVIPGHGGEMIRAYWSRPMGGGPYPGLVLIPHGPGWDEFCRETARRFSAHGYSVLCPNIYEKAGGGTPAEAKTRLNEIDGPADDEVMEDTSAALRFLRSQPSGNGKVGVIGMCSAGRHTFLAACTVKGFDAAVDCWGGGVTASKEQLTPARPVAPIEYAADLACPLMGIFGKEDHNPTPQDVKTLADTLTGYGKDFVFHEFEGAGHAFWCYDQPDKYRPQQCMEAWELVFRFFEKHLRCPKEE